MKGRLSDINSILYDYMHTASLGKRDGHISGHVTTSRQYSMYFLVRIFIEKGTIKLSSEAFWRGCVISLFRGVFLPIFHTAISSPANLRNYNGRLVIPSLSHLSAKCDNTGGRDRRID